ncbi:MAG: Rieske (2Fe-2S) protein [Proteobacteria bacterium]|nr:Rieske (2Fe-2S) protein [Pseudomonadota bacterium]
MPSTFELCLEAELNDDEPIECDGPNGELIAVVRHQGKVYAVAGECPHQAAPMADAEVANGKITCCLHFWTWSLADGTPVEEAEEPLPMFPVVVENGKVLLQIAD